VGSAHQHEPPPNPQRWAQPTLRPYSIIGRSRVGGIDSKDPRVQLYREYLRILAVHRPAVFVMENVRGILSARLEDRSVFSQILQDLQEPTAAIRTSTGKRRIRAGDAAYRVWSLVKKPGNSLIDASPLFEPGDDLIKCEEYGIPQPRHRVIILGIRDDLSKSPRTLSAHERSISLPHYYLEDVATEFHVQGLELDWTCVTWDADFRHTETGWSHWSFIGTRWNRIRKPERQDDLKNAYRVLLTRARQGMAIVVPEGEPEDPTRPGSIGEAKSLECRFRDRGIAVHSASRIRCAGSSNPETACVYGGFTGLAFLL